MSRSLRGRLSAGWVAILLAIGCGGNSPPTAGRDGPARSLRVAAAADLQFVLPAALGEFAKTHPEIKVETTYGASGALFAQLANGAPYDVFLSADVEYPRRLLEQGAAAADSLFRYAEGRIVVWTRAESALDVERLGLAALTDPGVRKIAIANPKHAPYGRAAAAALRQAGVHDSIAARLTFAENVAQAAQFVESGAADAGIIALSLASSPALKGKGRFAIVPRELHPPLEQGGAILVRSREPAAAAALRAFLIGPDGRRILAAHDLQPAGE